MMRNGPYFLYFFELCKVLHNPFCPNAFKRNLKHRVVAHWDGVYDEPLAKRLVPDAVARLELLRGSLSGGRCAPCARVRGKA